MERGSRPSLRYNRPDLHMLHCLGHEELGFPVLSFSRHQTLGSIVL